MPSSLAGRAFPASTSQDIKDGACLVCLANGETRFPLDPRSHISRSGHVPEIADLPKLCAALNITVERWETIAATALATIQSGEIHA